MNNWQILIFLFQVASTLVTLTAFIIIKTNDLKHLDLDVKYLKEKREIDNKEFAEIVQKSAESTNIELKNICAEIAKIRELTMVRDKLCEERHSRNGKKASRKKRQA